MSDKRKHRNPAIVAAEQRGFENGFHDGIKASEMAIQAAKEKWAIQILDWFDSLGEIPGIGSKRVEQIANHFANTFRGDLGNGNKK